VDKVTILGAGAGGLALAYDISKINNLDVTLCSGYSPQHVDKLYKKQCFKVIDYENKITEEVNINLKLDIQDAVKDANLLMVVCPAMQRLFYVSKILNFMEKDTKLLLIPGGFGTGSFLSKNYNINDFLELNQLPYVTRFDGEKLDLYYRLKKFWFGSNLDHNDYSVILNKFFKADFNKVKSVQEAEFFYWNMILHPPIMIGNEEKIKQGIKFKFYREGITLKVLEYMTQLDEERILVGKELGYNLVPIKDYLSGDYSGLTSLESALLNDEATGEVFAPNTLNHRYLTEDIHYGLVPLSELAKSCGVNTPMINYLIKRTNNILNVDFYKGGFNQKIKNE